jgi:hypothetical protein
LIGDRASEEEKLNLFWNAEIAEWQNSLPLLSITFLLGEEVDFGLEDHPGLLGQHSQQSCLHFLVLQAVDEGIYQWGHHTVLHGKHLLQG